MSAPDDYQKVALQILKKALPRTVTVSLLYDAESALSQLQSAQAPATELQALTKALFDFVAGRQGDESSGCALWCHLSILKRPLCPHFIKNANPAARNLGNYHGTGEIVPCVNRTLKGEWLSQHFRPF